MDDAVGVEEFTSSGDALLLIELPHLLNPASGWAERGQERGRERGQERERERQTQTQVHMHTCTHKAHKTSGASRGAHWSKREQLGLVAPLLVQAIKMLCFALQILKL